MVELVAGAIGREVDDTIFHGTVPAAVLAYDLMQHGSDAAVAQGSRTMEAVSG